MDHYKFQNYIGSLFYRETAITGKYRSFDYCSAQDDSPLKRRVWPVSDYSEIQKKMILI